MSSSVGVLALQGSFNEHISTLRKLGVEAIEVRKPEQLETLSALIIPGGESTTMAKLAAQYNLIPALREFEASGRPIWGTCAGLIFLANNVIGQKKGGQELIGGLDCTVHRNFFGSQLNSFEVELPTPSLAEVGGGPPTFRAVFIRAPAILEVGPKVEVLAEYDVPESLVTETNMEAQKVVVAVRQGNLLATAFHPELTSDTRWHQLFLQMADDGKKSDSIVLAQPLVKPLPQITQRKELPVFVGSDHLNLES